MHSHVSPPERLHRITILLIDDDKEDRTNWSNALRNSPYHYAVLEADSGESGFNLFREHTVDCVVLDLDMPESGFFTLVQLIPDCERPQVPVVILTKLMQPTLFNLAKKNGAYACLVKHLCSIEELTRTIQQAMASVKSMENGA
jgi:two-component system invasion response regulator UvrY